MATYGGDEVSTLVMDVGGHSIRAGYAGEEAPRAYFHSLVGRPCVEEEKPEDRDGDTDMSDDTSKPSSSSSSSSSSATAGDLVNGTWRPNFKLTPILNEDDLVEDWEGLEAAWSYALKDRLRVDPKEFPILCTEPAWAPKDQRAKMAEMAFETFGLPAFFLAKSPMLNAFTGGKSTALVIDVGGAQSSVVPVVDGYVLRRAIQRQPIAGNFLSKVILSSLTKAGAPNVIHVPYEIISKRSVAPNRPAEVVLRDRPNTHPTFHHQAQLRVVEEYKESVCQVNEIPWDEESIAIRASKPFEFPDGYNVSAGPERLRIPEILFNPSFSPEPLPPSTKSVPQMVTAALEACDPDVRGSLLANLVITGASTAFPGFSERLLLELSTLIPSARIKIVHGSNFGSSGGGTGGGSVHSMDRRFSAWLGGSILGSLGSFQQMWVGRAEWEEGGASVLEKKCQ
ncbi:MAG: actin family [Piptocephalis tieghemiana]|nr:MAG: actin family [Piptocephalis tieghemiana]